MKETEAILRAFKALQAAGKRAILATVVEVEGSSYRRPGARMLIAEDSCMTGAISGGCLEGDALRKALLALHQNQNKLVVYDTSDEEGQQMGIQLGCNGVVRLLFEPVQETASHHPMQLLQQLADHKEPGALVTLFNRDTTGEQPGTCMFYNQKSNLTGVGIEESSAQKMKDAARAAIDNEHSFFLKYSDAGIMAFVEYIAPALELVICGAGNDAIPLSELAYNLGWRVTVTDGRPAHATQARFAHAQQVITGRAEAILHHAPAGSRTVYMLMTHNYAYDLSALRALIHTDSPYIGILGPRAKTEQMLSDLKREGMVVSSAQKAKIFGPAGLDIGAETAEEIALSIVAEIKSVMENASAMPLREKNDVIHKRVAAYAS